MAVCNDESGIPPHEWAWTKQRDDGEKRRAEEWARLYHFPNEMGALGTIHFPNT